MSELLHQPGFLGTSANWAADMTLVASLIVAALFTIGAVLAVRRQYGAHRVVQTTAAVTNAVLVLWMMILPFRDFVMPADNPAGLSQPALWTTRIHAAVGAAALIFGLFVTLRGNGLVPKPLQFSNYKAYMRLAYGLYMLATLIGVVVYITWFVGNPTPPHLLDCRGFPLTVWSGCSPILNEMTSIHGRTGRKTHSLPSGFSYNLPDNQPSHRFLVHSLRPFPGNLSQNCISCRLEG